MHKSCLTRGCAGRWGRCQELLNKYMNTCSSRLLSLRLSPRLTRLFCQHSLALQGWIGTSRSARSPLGLVLVRGPSWLLAPATPSPSPARNARLGPTGRAHAPASPPCPATWASGLRKALLRYNGGERATLPGFGNYEANPTIAATRFARGCAFRPETFIPLNFGASEGPHPRCLVH